MNESENVITLTGRGFRATLEASVVCEAIEKSILETSNKYRLIEVLKSITVKEVIETLALLSAAKELFSDNPENYNVVVNIVISIQQQVNF